MTGRPAARRLLFRLEKSAQRWRFRKLAPPAFGWPILLGISFPKSGTHLLDQILLGFSSVAPFSRRLHSFYAEYEGVSGRKRAVQDAELWLDSLRSRDVASAHLFARPGAVGRVHGNEFVPYFLFRDPRDVAVSHAFYVTEMEPRHVHHAYYSSLSDFSERLRVSIEGLPGGAVEFPDIAQRFAPYLGWLEEDAVLKIRYEDLVNARRETLGRIIGRFLVRVPLRESAPVLARLEQAIQPDKSPTFRSGKTGEWRRYFTPEHKARFKEVSADLLIRLGYETNNDW